MAWLEIAGAAVTAAQLANDAAKSKGFFYKHLKRIGYFISNGKTTLPIFGAGGVGKSSIGKLLEDASHDLDGYEESWDVEDVRLKGEVPVQVLVAPGQISRVDFYWPDLFRGVGKGHAVGLINVVSYGYHSLNIRKISEHDEFQEGDDVSTFLNRYAEKRRELEVEMLQKVLSGIEQADRRLWMVTIVNKQDLWEGSAAAVRRHYEDGAYGRAIKEHTAKVGAQSFQHEFVPASLTLENLVTGSGEVLKSTSAGYDVPRHQVSLGFLLGQVENMIAKGKR